MLEQSGRGQSTSHMLMQEVRWSVDLYCETFFVSPHDDCINAVPLVGDELFLDERAQLSKSGDYLLLKQRWRAFPCSSRESCKAALPQLERNRRRQLQLPVPKHPLMTLAQVNIIPTSIFAELGKNRPEKPLRVSVSYRACPCDIGEVLCGEVEDLSLRLSRHCVKEIAIRPAKHREGPGGERQH
eukprot:gnl/TRDRNA2_/TRDRNA2_171230_c10_seq1.p1 gnl/TRDRNA2_/TRDRNA2_171230_c10~~gnl/TRDRNA2_/TRDRNA2_171230_c10_seq1.p1  ORF type:complete len:185 (-),score=29.00 gnl/TRDRNA2_/TRDRNA2_171230_c10_seq1:536-1090(-)